MAILGAVAIGAPRAQEPAVSKQVAELKMIDATLQNLRVGVESRLTKNAPYSAEAVTESVQTLADGNRIVSKNATRIFRDSEGRMRREQLSTGGTDVVNINISDPVAGTSYVLDPATRTAYHSGMFITGPMTVTARGRGAATLTQTPEAGVVVMGPELELRSADDDKANAEAKVTAEMKVRTAEGGRVGRGGGSFMAAGLSAKIADAIGKTTSEDLGQQTIEGVVATGTRTTTEIAAGTIGNEQPIKIVSEQWFSPDLQVLVQTKHTDPRVGETTYRLAGIVRAEPAHALFELPADYTLKESAIRRRQQ
jgi:hypothetical protein